MAKKTFTDRVAADHDTNSPYEEGLVERFQDNNITLIKTPFYLRWHDANGGDSKNGRDFFHTSDPVFDFRDGWWKTWIAPGTSRLKIFVEIAVGTAGADGNVKWRLGISAPNQTPDTFVEKIASFAGAPVVDPVFERVNIEFARADLEPRWGRMARLSMALIRTAGSGSETMRAKETVDAVCYWGQEP